MSLVRNPISRASSIGYFEANLDLKLTSRLQLDDIHVLLSSRSGYETTEVTFRTGHVALGTIWASSDLTKVIPFSGLLSLPTILAPKDIVRQPWWYWENGHRTPCSREDVMPGGWTRITLPPNLQKAFHLTTRVKIQTSTRCEMLKCWLTQANSIACKHGGEICSLPVVGMNMISAVSSYWIPGGVKFRISIYPEDCCTLRGTFMADTPTSDIYLFLFKPEVEFVEGYPIIKIPAPREALYWSFDPQGRERLSSQMAEEIGVPYVFFDSGVTGLSWARESTTYWLSFTAPRASIHLPAKLPFSLAIHSSGPQRHRTHLYPKSMKLKSNMRNAN
ncbi:hypothetical protein B0H13DRAFT_457809 [Mycena leptocephala]|nr:hypothetical protein B0H13DRAFT_457809 [Mycena leptocephala]